YYRLQVLPIEVPPLRTRPEDIELLTHYFVRYFSRKLNLDPLKISNEIMARLQAYEWPGNVRELKNFIERSLILGYFPKEDLPLNLNLDERSDLTEQAEQSALSESLETVERNHITKVLAACNGNKSEAARVLRISRKTLERKCIAWNQD
ncbi:helix-turn-helix domain-containing protein, partial [Limnobacter sp.]